jgi:hypothetical protein
LGEHSTQGTDRACGDMRSRWFIMALKRIQGPYQSQHAERERAGNHANHLTWLGGKTSTFIVCTQLVEQVARVLQQEVPVPFTHS